MGRLHPCRRRNHHHASQEPVAYGEHEHEDDVDGVGVDEDGRVVPALRGQVAHHEQRYKHNPTMLPGIDTKNCFKSL